LKLGPVFIKGSKPHPTDLEKSLPVPMGLIPKTRRFGSIPTAISSLTTQSMVPSPPEMMTLMFVLS